MHLIERANIRLKVPAITWRQAVYEAGLLLANTGKIRMTYIDHMIDSVIELGAYIVIIPHVAIAHARPDENVLEEGVSLITLQTPVEFGNCDNDPVDLVFAFASKSSTGHLQTIAMLSQLLENEQCLQAIRGLKDIDAVFELINQTTRGKEQSNG
jgi:PTS system ascorbate-specific IIA component